MEAHLRRKNVRGPGGKDPQRHARISHSIDDFIDSAVAAGRDNQICPSLDAIARNRGSCPRAGSRENLNVGPLAAQGLYRRVKRMTPPPLECACEGIVDQEGLPVGLDSNLIIVNADAKISG